eukprot:CFRG2487T1
MRHLMMSQLFIAHSVCTALFSLLTVCNSYVSAYATRLSATNDSSNFLESYGTWCGGGHGGFQDCCGGQRCPNCVVKRGVVPASLLTPECLAECPPTDILDRACAWHDACTFSHERPQNFTCSPQGNECFCDCTIVKTAYNITCPSYSCTAYRAALDELFLHGTACYSKDENGTLTCEGLRSGVGLLTHCDRAEPLTYEFLLNLGVKDDDV